MSTQTETPSALPARKAIHLTSDLRLHRCDGHLLAISSTELRERVKHRLSLDYFVPHKAIVYIREKNLYRQSP